jgi:hypothetical protein
MRALVGGREQFVNHAGPKLGCKWNRAAGVGSGGTWPPARFQYPSQERAMRSTVIIVLLAAIAANGAVLAADLPDVRGKVRRIVKAPPRPAAVVVEEDESLISPMLPSTPLLLGRQELPGYYGRAFSYDYQGPYYGGERIPSYLFRLPYACGVTGYC